MNNELTFKAIDENMPETLFDNKKIILHPTLGHIMELDVYGIEIWDLITIQKKNFGEIVSHIAEKYDSNKQEIEQDAKELIDTLLENNFIERT